RYLTGFFLLMSLGGVLGGLFNALVAPLIFNDLYEYEVALVLACMLIPPLGSAGGTSITTWILRQFAGGTSRIGNMSRRLLHVLDFSKHGWGGRLAGLGFDVLLVFLLFCIGYGFATFFDNESRHARWIDKIPEWLADVRVWIAARIDQVVAKGHVSETQFRAILKFGVPILICYAFVTRPFRFGLGVVALLAVGFYAAAATQDEDVKVVYQVRSFFGVLKVDHSSKGNWYRLMHGTTTHGLQYRGTEEEFEPQTYYHKTGPIGQVFEALDSRLAKKNLAFVGLGSGTLACYGRAGQRVDFYDIDKAVVDLSANRSDYFTYYTNCKATKRVILGDARLKMEEAEPGRYALIALDAFSSDAIPIHLITRQALELYFSKLEPDGVLAVHISNRYLNLQPVLANLARELKLVAYREYDDDEHGGKYRSDWVVLARKPEDLGGLLSDKGWQPTEPNDKVGVWTDDFSNLLRVFDWKN
ncbi:MAG TPA: fused MFS/spermidine synthase, partial [Gemmataceae bacterium]|nr:fused MFS/spermidine synthase [Gemmataceae bacterium]